MPKTFSESERVFIKKRLMEESKLCLSQYGVRKTTVDELVRRVNIPKGTFYLFYDSKELLFYDVLCEFHDEIQKELMEKVTSISDGITPQKLTDIIMELYKMVDESFLIRFLSENELELLFRKLPPEIAQSHALEDNLRIEQLFLAAPQLNSENIDVFSAAMRGAFTTMLHKSEIGKDVFDDALRMLIYGVVLQAFKEEN